jgi:hypothetical protein
VHAQLIKPRGRVSGGTCQPRSVTFAPISAAAVNQDFEAILIGDCTLSWPSEGRRHQRREAENGGWRYSPASCSARRTTSSLIQNLASVRSCSSNGAIIETSSRRLVAPIREV